MNYLHASMTELFQVRRAASCHRFAIVGVACTCFAILGCAPDNGPEFKLLREYDQYVAPVVSVAISSDSTLIACGGPKKIMTSDIETGRALHRFDESPYSLGFLPNTYVLLVAGGRGELALWNAKEGHKIADIARLKFPQYSVAVSNDGRFGLTGDGYEIRDGEFVAGEYGVHLWDLEKRTHVREFRSHRGAIYSVAFSPDGKSALSAACDATMRLWDTATGEELQRYGELYIPQQFNNLPHGSVCFSPDGKLGLKGWQLWDLETGEQLHRLRIEKPDPKFSLNIIVESYAKVGAFTPDGTHIVSGDNDGRIRLWETSTGKLLCEARAFKNRSEVWSIALSPDGKMVLTGGYGHVSGYTSPMKGEPASDLTVRLFKLPE